MGSYAYDYLNDSLLLDGALASQLYQGISDLTLERELTRYREYCIKILPEVRKDVKASNDVLREGANKQVISSQADSLIKISRIWADF
ncbi:hypothetical protein, partial [Citrobacter freundii]|uniref:hypothetical protein n=1 Tax=Citrobacter freundii TaxID=546 RepID=UPI001E4FB0A3